MPLLHRYHESMACRLLDEPGMPDLSSLNQVRGETARARSSILGYNEIIWSQGKVQNQGSVAKLDLDYGLEQKLPDECTHSEILERFEGNTCSLNLSSASSMPFILPAGNTSDEGCIEPTMVSLGSVQSDGDFAGYLSGEIYSLPVIDWDELNITLETGYG